jgi:hypothetical protein
MDGYSSPTGNSAEQREPSSDPLEDLPGANAKLGRRSFGSRSLGVRSRASYLPEGRGSQSPAGKGPVPGLFSVRDTSRARRLCTSRCSRDATCGTECDLSRLLRAMVEGRRREK